MPEFMSIPNMFLAVGVFATIFYILKICLFIFTGGDAEVHTDFVSLTDTDVSFDFISIQSILAFLMGFGWVGLACFVQFKLSTLISFIAAFVLGLIFMFLSAYLMFLVLGLIFMFLSAYLMFLIKKLDKRVKINLEDFVGTVGRAYTAFKPQGEGQIEITINEQLSVIEAFNMTDEEIHAFMPVKIEKVENNKIFIVRV